MEYSNTHKQFVRGIKLPTIYTEEDRGLEKCCCKFVVWGSNENDPWKKMKTSAWWRDSDTVRFYLVASDGAEIEQTTQSFVDQTSAKYCTVDWSTVLNDSGSGCYKLNIDFSIEGIEGTVTWGEYQLFEFSLFLARKYCQFRTILNANQKLDGISFIGSNVVDCINFEVDFFGDRDPGTEIDNITYETRETKPVIRENVNKYSLVTRPVSSCISNKLFDVHLLSENNLFISDFKPNNHIQYLNKNVIVSQVETPQYFNPYVKVKAKFEDKFKNSVTVNSR